MSLLLNRNTYFLIALAGLLSLIGWGYFKISSLEKNLSIANQKVGFYQYDSLKTQNVFKNKEGKWVNEKSTMEISAKALKDLASAGDKRVLKLQVENSDLKKNFKNLQSYKTFTAETNNVVDGLMVLDTEEVAGDTQQVNGVKPIHLETPWECYDVTIKGDSIHIKREGRESFDEVVYWKRKKFLFLRIGKKKYFSDIKSLNPSTKVITQNSLIVKKEKP